MANSADVNAGDSVLASQYNNLRADVLSITTGHTHNGTDSKVVADDSVTSGKIKNDAVIAGKIADNGVTTGNLANVASYAAGQVRAYSVPPSAFVEGFESVDGIEFYVAIIQPKALGANYAQAPLRLPAAAIITQFGCNWNRTAAAATGTARLIRVTIQNGSESEMAAADSNSSGGQHYVEDTTIANPTVDNDTYHYVIEIIMDADASKSDVYSYGCIVTFTITEPKP